MKVEAELRVDKRPKWDSDHRLETTIRKQDELTHLGLYCPSAYFGDKNQTVLGLRSSL